LFYIPSKEAISPTLHPSEVRRKDVGREIVDRASQKLKAMGAEIIVAEFPAQNAIAVRFYSKRGFRPS